MGYILSAEDPAAIARAAAVIREGGVVAFPTETVYGLGADAFNRDAVARVFEIKARPSFDPLIVHVADATQAARVAEVQDARFKRLAEAFWPGPLTLILPKREDVPLLVSAGLSTVGVRVPRHPAARQLIQASLTAIAAPSANPFGYVSPTQAAHVHDLLGARIDLTLDGGACSVGLESTVLSLMSAVPVILRPGAVTAEELRAVIGAVALGAEVLSSKEGLRYAGAFTLPQSQVPVSPGQGLRHYATRTPLRILTARDQHYMGGSEKVGLLAFEQAPQRHGYHAVEVLAPDGDLRTAAGHLFSALRRLDALGLDRLIAEAVPAKGLGVAIMDRLRRCAAH